MGTEVLLHSIRLLSLPMHPASAKTGGTITFSVAKFLSELTAKPAIKRKEIELCVYVHKHLCSLNHYLLQVLVVGKPLSHLPGPIQFAILFHRCR